MLPGEHSAILFTFIKLPFVIKIFVLSIFEWPLKTGFTVWDVWLGLPSIYGILADLTTIYKGAQWLSSRVLDSRPKGHRFERHCVVVLEQDTVILA